MRKILIVMIALMITILPSCASEEEKALNEARDKYEDILDGFADLLKDNDNLSQNDVDDMNEMISIAKTKMSEAATVEAIEAAGRNATANLMFMSMFVLTEDEFMDHVNKIVEKYPDLESYLLG